MKMLDCFRRGARGGEVREKRLLVFREEEKKLTPLPDHPERRGERRALYFSRGRKGSRKGVFLRLARKRKGPRD